MSKQRWFTVWWHHHYIKHTCAQCGCRLCECLCSLKKTLTPDLNRSVLFRVIQVPVSVGQVRLVMRLSACRAFLSARTNIPDLHTSRRHRNHREGFSCGHRSAVVCGARSPVSSPDKTRKWNSTAREEGWRDKQKLVNKNIFPPLQWDFSDSLSGTERRLSRLNELGGYGRFNPQQVHQTSTKPE